MSYLIDDFINVIKYIYIFKYTETMMSAMVFFMASLAVPWYIRAFSKRGFWHRLHSLKFPSLLNFLPNKHFVFLKVLFVSLPGPGEFALLACI